MTAAEVIGGSMAARLVRRARTVAETVGPARHFSGRWHALGTDIQDPAATSHDEVVLVVLGDSAVVKAALGGLSRLDRVARRSLAAVALGTLTEHLGRLAIRDRVRLASLMLLTALVVHVALTTVGAPARSGASGAAGLIAFVALTASIAGARSIEAAWIEWSGRGSRRRESEPM